MKKVEPRSWQTKAFSIWQTSQRGIVAAVTGAGKTTFALMCIAEFHEKTKEGIVIVIVPTVALQDQWVLALVDELGVPMNEIGIISGAKKSWTGKKYIVSVINSMRDRTAQISKSVSTMLIVDECHRAGSSKNAEALSGHFVATLGLSATPERQYDDGFDRYIRPALGEIIYVYDYKEAQKDNVIVPFELRNVRFNLSSKEQNEYDDLTRKIAILLRKHSEQNESKLEALLRRRARISWNSNLRIPLAAKLALNHLNERMIIFHESIQHANMINALLNERGVRSTIYHAKLSREKRLENLRLFKNGYYECLVCCRALDEGLNVPNVSIGIVASSTSSIRQRVQRLGRVLRLVEGKQSAIIYTLFATESESNRLQEEYWKMLDISIIRWLDAKVVIDG